MPDALLALIVENVETGRWSQTRVSVAIPGGIVAGELISARQFIDEWEEQTNIYLLGGFSSEADQPFSLPESAHPGDIPIASPDYLHLRDAVLVSPSPLGRKPPRFGLMRIGLENVAAWSLGRLETE
jgi:hypothetical protein